MGPPPSVRPPRCVGSSSSDPRRSAQRGAGSAADHVCPLERMHPRQGRRAHRPGPGPSTDLAPSTRRCGLALKGSRPPVSFEGPQIPAAGDLRGHLLPTHRVGAKQGPSRWRRCQEHRLQAPGRGYGDSFGLRPTAGLDFTRGGAVRGLLWLFPPVDRSPSGRCHQVEGP